MVNRLNTNFERGFTIIEILVALVIAGALSVMAMQLGKNWYDSIKVNEANSSLMSAYSIAKSKALINSMSSPIGSVMILSNSTVCVKVGATNMINCNSGYVWKKDLSATVTISKSTATCLALDNSAVPIETLICKPNTTYKINRGTQNAQGTLI